MSAALELDRVTYRYPGAAAPALRGVTLEIEPGELVVLAGASASGKSTLLRVAERPRAALPRRPLRRAAPRSAAWTCASTGPAALAREVGTLFQDPETQVVMGTVRAELAFPLENRGAGAVAVARGVEEVALALGIEAPARPLDRRRSPAASSSASRSAPRSPGARGCSCSTSRPRSSTRSPATS